MRCSDCNHWITQRKTVYDNGEEVINYQSPEGLGNCQILNMDTKPEFGCVSFLQSDNHIVITTKSGAPWHHWVMIPCPACGGNPGLGAGGRCKCAGTGNVRQYDDGYVADEQTRVHPNSKKVDVPEVDPNTVLQPVEKPSVIGQDGVV